MTTRRLTWLAVLGLLTFFAAATSPAFPQEEEADTDAAVAEAVPQSSAVDEILQQQEAMLSGQRFTYDPGNRRDPFRNLMIMAPSNDDRACGDGISCMVLAEVDLSGIVRDDGDGDVALFMGSDNQGYFLRVGDAVYDGTIIGIDPRLGTVTFRQEIDDPRRIKPYRDVVKRLAALDNEESNR